DPGSSSGGRRGGLKVAQGPIPKVGGDQQVALLDTVTSLLFEQPLSASEPPARAGNLAAKHEMHPKPEGAAHRPQTLAAVEVTLVGTLQRAQLLLVVTEHVGGSRQK